MGRVISPPAISGPDNEESPGPTEETPVVTEPSTEPSENTTAPEEVPEEETTTE